MCDLWNQAINLLIATRGGGKEMVSGEDCFALEMTAADERCASRRLLSANDGYTFL